MIFFHRLYINEIRLATIYQQVMKYSHNLRSYTFERLGLIIILSGKSKRETHFIPWDR